MFDKSGYIYSTNSYYFGDTITWDGTNYALSNSDGSEVVQTNYRENYNNFKGKYSCFSTTASTCTTVYYIAGTTSSYVYILALRNGQLLENVNTEWNFGKTVTYENGQYTIVEPETINKADWYTKYSTYSNKGYYTCSDGSTSCAEINYIISANNAYMTNVKMSNGETYESLYEQAKNVKWIYGNDIVWDGTNYTLTNTIESNILNWSSDRTNLGKGYHYTCFTTGDSCSSVYYVYYSGTSSPYYITLKNGTTIDKAMEEMQTNTTNSTIKTTIDKWYGENMTEYTTYLEDTVWCNDRSMGNSNGWTKDGNANNYLYYSPKERRDTTRKPDINCSNKNDAFTVSEENGNGALTYPVALLTSDEIMLAGGQTSSNNSYYLYTNQYWWSLSPSNFDYYYANGFYVSMDGYLSLNSVYSSYGVRPSVSLKPGIRTAEGDGTAEDPYTILID